tara:strand:- start:7337 stop:7774 length:438 start_codon:yes stop_codon:yes gene_type:complete
MAKIQKDVNKRADRALRAAMLTMATEIIIGTPVDTGRAKANWQSSVGKPKAAELGETDKSGGATIAEASGAISVALGNKYFLTNNLPYIGLLEFGKPKAAGLGETDNGVLEFVPGFTKKQKVGWVRSAVQRFVPNLEKNLKAENL